MMKDWAKFMYEDKETLVSAGDCVHQRPGITHYLFDYSPDMEYLEITGPADVGTVDVEGPARFRHRLGGRRSQGRIRTSFEQESAAFRLRF